MLCKDPDENRDSRVEEPISPVKRVLWLDTFGVDVGQNGQKEIVVGRIDRFRRSKEESRSTIHQTLHLDAIDPDQERLGSCKASSKREKRDEEHDRNGNDKRANEPP